MILVDTSAWVEFIRGTESSVGRRLQALVAADQEEIVTTEVVFLELLAGAHDEARAASLRRMLSHYELIPIEGLSDFESAAAIYRSCRRHGETIRTRFDCLIAAVALREDAAVLHHDRDFDAIARHTPLQLAAA